MRDYAADMRTVIDAETNGGAYSSPVVAAQIVEKLRVNDPELLEGWLSSQAERLIWQAINDRDRSVRAHARHGASRSVFATTVKAHEEGDSTALRGWMATPFAVAQGVRKPLAMMTAGDLTYAADGYKRRSNENLLTAVFLAKLADKVKDGTVADHFTEDQVLKMWESVSG